MKFSIIIFLYLISLLNFIKSNEIIISIKGSGNQRFISNNAEQNHAHCPNEVYILDGNKIGNNICEYTFETEENKILLKWYEPIDGYELFKELNNIIEIHFSRCSIIKSMHQIFYGSKSLKSINFTGLQINSANSPVNTMYGAFRYCESLTTLDLTPLEIPNLDFRFLFYDCKNLEYINFKNYDESKVRNNWKLEFDDKVPKNLVICIEETIAQNLFSTLSNRECTVIYCGDDWREKQKKISKESNTCVETCQNQNEYKYNNKCYSQCPEGLIGYNNLCLDPELVPVEKTTELNLNVGKTSIITIITTMTDFDKKISSIVTNLDIYDTKKSTYLNKICYINDNEMILAKDKKIHELKENLINGDMNDILKNITENKEDLIQVDDDKTSFQITTTENQKLNKNNNISTINFGACENKLKKVYQINETLPLIIFKIDYYPPDLLIPIVGYEVYHPINKSKLDLSYCEDILVELNIPVSISEDNLFKYNPDSDYYTDDCYSYTTENGTDIILSDRQQEFKDNNLSLCENKCNYIGYNQSNKQSTCNCSIKNKIDLISEIIDNPDKLSNNFNSNESLSSKSNVIIMKCAKSLFTKEGMKNNIANYLLLFIIMFFLFSIIIFIKCGFPLLKKDIEQIVKNKYNDEKNKKIKNKNIMIRRKNPNQFNKKKRSKNFGNFPPKKYKIINTIILIQVQYQTVTLI